MNGSRIALAIVGILVLLSGTVFALQGSGHFPGQSFMNNNPPWIYIGVFLFIIGLLMIIFAFGYIGKSGKGIQSTI